MADGRVGLGQRGETLAAQALQRHGFTLVDRNWRCPYGEVDLVMRLGEHIYFVEVRTRHTTAYPAPEHSLRPSKLSRMETVARAYLGAHHPEAESIWHVSFVAVATSRAGQLQRITFYPSVEAQPVELLD
jgi:putative endonuclease